MNGSPSLQGSIEVKILPLPVNQDPTSSVDSPFPPFGLIISDSMHDYHLIDKVSSDHWQVKEMPEEVAHIWKELLTWALTKDYEDWLHLTNSPIPGPEIWACALLGQVGLTPEAWQSMPSPKFGTYEMVYPDGRKSGRSALILVAGDSEEDPIFLDLQGSFTRMSKHILSLDLYTASNHTACTMAGLLSWYVFEEQSVPPFLTINTLGVKGIKV